MLPIAAQISNLFCKIPGRTYLLLAIVIFATANSVLRKLTELGANHLIDGRNPISFCNVLFAGNLCAVLVLILIYGKQWTPQTLRQLSWSDWVGLSGVALLSGALAPALTFMALDLTMVNNVILIGRIEPPLILALSVLILRERVNPWVVAGAVFSFIGVILTLLIPEPGEKMLEMGMGFNLGKGELMAAGGAISLAVSTVISKVKLRQISLAIFTIFRTGTGLVVFFVIVFKLFGPSHFMDVFAPFVWQWMILYGALIVVGGQLCWFQGLKKTGASDVSLASSFSPIAGILAAYLILGEVPTLPQYIGGSIIILGIILNQIGVQKKTAHFH
ncbi:DMT family transporter [Phormidium sp. CCY1219]|uniref:DMT family transporter n=1 Tax=Phormidium sp. CCY1219 TaxID=2886104 RepID=UPI002D1E94D6|nr:DMT family transporter [Phormidium sp. CCY1219]MEB3829947.1 DMT family transporter [Phormidium sp. CCY1219]